MPSSARFANSRICFSMRREAQTIGIADHRHDQALGGADRDADVVVVLEHHLVALDLGVEARERAQRADRGLDEERRDAEADAVLLLERLLVPLAQRHHRGHVDFVEGAEHRRGALRLDQPLGDGRAPLRHAHALFGAVAGGTRRRLGDRTGRPRLRRLGGGPGLGLGRLRAGGRLPVPATAPADSAARSTSRFITRPASPLPCTCEMSTSFCSAAFFAVGVARGLGALRFVRRRLRRRSARRRSRSAGAVDAPDAADSSITPSTSPTLTSSPSLRSIRLSTPACGAPTSRSILSVSSSTSGSPADTGRLPCAATWRRGHRRWTHRLRGRRCLLA